MRSKVCQRQLDIHYCGSICGMCRVLVTDVTTIRDFVLVADSYIQEIYRMDLETGSYSAIPQYSVNTPIGIDYDPLTHTVFYSDVGLHQIKSTDLDGNNEKILKRLNSGKTNDVLLIK